jgi:ABC-2 type transport system ATP-binding protein
MAEIRDWAVIQAEGLSKLFGHVRALDNVSFTVEPGEIVGFLGPNGAGKTTAMRILACIFPPTSGRARICGFDVLEHPLEVRRRIGYLPEVAPFYPDLTVSETLSFVCEMKGVPARRRREEIRKNMALCALEKVSHRLVGKLSKGFRQRVGLAQALLNDPPVLILDEPTLGLDPEQIIEIRNLIKNLKGDRTVILSTHILPEVSVTCQRVLIIHQGRIQAMDTPENLTAQLQAGQELTIRLGGPAEEVLASLRAIRGVLSVEEVLRRDHDIILTLKAEKGVPVGKEVAALAYHGGWELKELLSKTLSIEEIFLKVVTREKPVPSAGGESNPK